MNRQTIALLVATLSIAVCGGRDAVAAAGAANSPGEFEADRS